MALDISRWRNNPATEEHHDNKSNLAKNGLVYAKVAQLVEQVKHLFLSVLKNTASANTNKKKSYGIVNPRVVGSSPTLGAVAFMPRSK